MPPPQRAIRVRDNQAPNVFGQFLRQWRTRRRMSQLDLALEAEISSRHLSFLETGRAQPSREMVVLLAEVLQMPLRDRNELLITAGYAPLYHETSLDAPVLAQLHRALDFTLHQQEPYPTAELLAYPDVPRHWRTRDLTAPLVPFLAIHFRKHDLDLRFFTTLTSLGTPYDITLQELRIESFFPADEATDAALRRLGGG